MGLNDQHVSARLCWLISAWHVLLSSVGNDFFLNAKQQATLKPVLASLSFAVVCKSSETLVVKTIGPYLRPLFPCNRVMEVEERVFRPIIW